MLIRAATYFVIQFDGSVIVYDGFRAPEAALCDAATAKQFDIVGWGLYLRWCCMGTPKFENEKEYSDKNDEQNHSGLLKFCVYEQTEYFTGEIDIPAGEVLVTA